MDGSIVSVSSPPGQAQILVGTNGGNIYRLQIDTSESRLVASSHVSPVVAVSFGTRSDIFATVSKNGNLRAWDLTDYR